MYQALKHTHQLLAIISVLGFILRSFWLFRQSPLLQAKLSKILPHAIDTLLLASAIGLMVTVNQYPFVNHWLTAKLLALIAYILFGVITLKKAQTNQAKVAALVAALSCFGYILAVAITKSPSLNML